jgi:hypothetical protein
MLGWLLFLIGIAGLYIYWQISLKRAGEKILVHWAEDNSYELLETKYRWFFLGPFFLQTSRYQSVHRIVVRELATGQIKSGWARCGNWFWGVLWTDDIAVIWDKYPTILIAVP